MPVLIAAASDDLGIVVPLARRLREDGGEVRCYLPEDDGELRHIGCKIAVGHPLDEMNLEASLTNVHTFVPVLPDLGGIDDPEVLEHVLRFGRVAAAAAGDADIAQTILCVPAAAPGHAVGRGLAEIVGAFTAVVEPLCVLRTGLVWRTDGPLAAGMRSLAPGLPEVLKDAVLAAVAVDDLVRLVAEVDDREQTHGSWEFGGTALPLEDLRTAYWGEGPAIPFSPWTTELLALGVEAGDSAESAFGVEARPLI